MNSSQPPPDYMLFFRGPDWDRGMDVDETQRVLDQAMAWFSALERQGKVKGALGLAREGRIIADGKVITDGPFAESKEAIGGYLLLSAASLDEAVAIARTCPTLPYGITVEVRPSLAECPIARRLRERRNEAVTA